MTVVGLSTSVLVSAASVLGTGVRTAQIGGLVEDCCDCLAEQSCLPSSETARSCSSEYNPIGAMTDQLVLHVARDGCEHICQDCQELVETYNVTLTTESLRDPGDTG